MKDLHDINCSCFECIMKDDDQLLVEQLQRALVLAREALSHTATDLMHENFEAEEKALLAIDFALEKL